MVSGGRLLAGRYALMEQLAGGAQGTVWRAVDHQGHQSGQSGQSGQSRQGSNEVAVKVIGTADVESLLRLVCEQSVRLGHPHVLAPLDWFVRDGEAWLVLPLVRGGTVATLLADYGRLPPTVGLLLAEQLLDALAAVHAAGLVHRDVKPSNLLLAATGTGRPHLYLADFGVARVRPHIHLTSRAIVVGTPDYLAPEVRAGHGSSPAQDVYAAGLVLAQLSAPADLVTAMTASDPDRRPTAAAAHAAIVQARARFGAEQWPVQWESETFTVFDQLGGTGEATGVTPSAGSTIRGSGAVPSSRAPRTRIAVAAAAAIVTAAAVATALMLPTTSSSTITPPAHGSESGAGTSRPAPAPAPSRPSRTVPTDADEGVPDPHGPEPFSRCEAEQQYSMMVSPEGYLLYCEHVPRTRDYEWTPRSASD